MNVVHVFDKFEKWVISGNKKIMPVVLSVVENCTWKHCKYRLYISDIISNFKSGNTPLQLFFLPYIYFLFF